VYAVTVTEMCQQLLPVEPVNCFSRWPTLPCVINVVINAAAAAVTAAATACCSCCLDRFVSSHHRQRLASTPLPWKLSFQASS
jgi:hypothetical protein